MSDEFKPDIWRLQAQMDIEGLVVALEDQDPAIRRRAATALRALGAYDAVPRLEAALNNETDGEARANLITALATLRQEKQYRETHPDDPYDLHRPPSIDLQTQKLLDDLRSGDPVMIVRAAKTLGKRNEKAAVVTLVSLFNNTETPIKVRLIVAEVLLALESAPLEVSLLGALRRDDWKARRNSAAILGQLKAEWAVEPLIRCLSDENKTVRLTAYAALTNIGTPAALTALEVVKQRAQQRVEKEKSQDQPPPMDETQQIEWPRTHPDDITSAPTKRLNPRTLDESDRYQSWAKERRSKPSDES